MRFELVAAAIATLLLLVYLGAAVVKLLDPALTIVILIGFVMMLIDLWQSLQSKGD